MGKVEAVRDPYYTDGVNVTLYCGDAREVLDELDAYGESSIADVAFIDAPAFGRDLDPGTLERAMSYAAREVVAVVGTREIFQVRNLFRVRGVMAWHANNVERSPYYTARADVAFILWGSYEKRHMFGKLLGPERWPSSLFMYPTAERGDELPVELVSAIMDGYPGDASFLDPFAGYGSTLLAAARQGRQATGIEIDEERCEIAAQRLRQQAAGDAGERYVEKYMPSMTPGGGP